MRLAIVLRPGMRKNLRKLLHGFTIVQHRPDFVLSYGGDGTFFIAERKYPGIPKILLRFSTICRKCSTGDSSHLLDHMRQGNFSLKYLPKLTVDGQDAVNDVIIRNMLLTEAIRFRVVVGRKIIGNFIGDGIVVATPYGSTGYFHSITRKSFSRGIGIAFNNTTVVQPPVFTSRSQIVFQLLRGRCSVALDNNRRIIRLTAGKNITIALSKRKTTIVRFSGH